MEKKRVLEELGELLPPILFRNHPKFREWVGISGRTAANLDALGKGPQQRVRVGGVVGYPKQTLLEWIQGRMRVEMGRGRGQEE